MQPHGGRWLTRGHRSNVTTHNPWPWTCPGPGPEYWKRRESCGQSKARDFWWPQQTWSGNVTTDDILVEYDVKYSWRNLLRWMHKTSGSFNNQQNFTPFLSLCRKYKELSDCIYDAYRAVKDSSCANGTVTSCIFHSCTCCLPSVRQMRRTRRGSHWGWCEAPRTNWNRKELSQVNEKRINMFFDHIPREYCILWRLHSHRQGARL